MEGYCFFNGIIEFLTTIIIFLKTKAIFLNVMILFSFSTDYGDRMQDMRLFGISSRTTSQTRYLTKKTKESLSKKKKKNQTNR